MGDDNGNGIMFFGGFCLGQILMFSLIYMLDPKEEARQEIRQEAVDNGVAEWTVDQTTGQKDFEWKNNENM